MKMTFRWYGEEDPVTLAAIRQIPGVAGIASAIYHIAVGKAWPCEAIKELKERVTAAGLVLEVIESLPVHEDIKLHRGKFQEYIENYKENIRRLAAEGVRCICYNFMPVFDWTRSRLDHPLADGSRTLAYYKTDEKTMDPAKMVLPGWNTSYFPEEIDGLIKAYQILGIEGLWGSLKYFINEIMPVAIECDVNMCLQPDDPPWPVFDIPRIITDEAAIDRFLALYNDTHHGLSLCTGSLGCAACNDIPRLVRKIGGLGRIHYAPMRNVKILQDGSFEESAHPSFCGSLDMEAVMKAYYDIGYTGYMSPAHGRMIWNEEGKPGYGLYDRALGAVYLIGIWETLKKECVPDSHRTGHLSS